MKGSLNIENVWNSVVKTFTRESCFFIYNRPEIHASEARCEAEN